MGQGAHLEPCKLLIIWRTRRDDSGLSYPEYFCPASCGPPSLRDDVVSRPQRSDRTPDHQTQKFTLSETLTERPRPGTVTPQGMLLSPIDSPCPR